MAQKCPQCRSTEVTDSIGDLHHCLTCTANFDSKGNLVANGPDATTRAVLEARLAPREVNLAGNYADIQRFGAAKAVDDKAPEFQLPAGVNKEDVGDGSAGSIANVTAAMSTTDGGGQEVVDDSPAKQAEAAASKDAAKKVK